MEQGDFYTSKQGKYPCIYFTLKDVKGHNFEEMMLNLQTELNELFIDNYYLTKSAKLLDAEKDMINTIVNFKANKVQLQGALKLLSRLLYKEHETPVYIMIDEYDVPLQNAYVEGFYEETVKFFKDFFGQTFKDN